MIHCIPIEVFLAPINNNTIGKNIFIYKQWIFIINLCRIYVFSNRCLSMIRNCYEKNLQITQINIRWRWITGRKLERNNAIIYLQLFISLLKTVHCQFFWQTFAQSKEKLLHARCPDMCCNLLANGLTLLYRVRGHGTVKTLLP